jgi:hypothetical protein
MINSLIVLSLWALLTILLPPMPAAAYELQAINKKKNNCQLHTALTEKKMGIPKHLLTAS